MPEVNHQEQLLKFLIWFLRKHIHEILSELNQTKSSKTDEMRDIFHYMLEKVTLAEYLDTPIEEKIDELNRFKYFVQTVSGADIHGDEAFRRGPDVD